jgi:hypothetical protein
VIAQKFESEARPKWGEEMDGATALIVCECVSTVPSADEELLSLITPAEGGGGGGGHLAKQQLNSDQDRRPQCF